MKTRTSLSLFAFVGLLVASHSTLAAAPKADAHANTLVAALQVVSPDPLGGRLGLAISPDRAPEVASAPISKEVAMKSPRAEADQRAYRIWKNSQKS